ATRPFGRPFPALSLSHHHELRQRLPEGAEPLASDSRNQTDDGQAHGLALQRCSATAKPSTGALNSLRSVHSTISATRNPAASAPPRNYASLWLKRLACVCSHFPSGNFSTVKRKNPPGFSRLAAPANTSSRSPL